MTNEAVAAMTKAVIDYAILHHASYSDINTIKIVGGFVDGYLAGCHGILTQKQQDESIAAVMKGLKNACK